MKFSSTNNFDLIRLIAASQVAINHTSAHLNYDNPLVDWLSLFPGVPIFFFVSGFLIYGSYEKSLADEKPLTNFFIKRFLRLYPALWLCILTTVGLLLVSNYFSTIEFSPIDFGTWLLTTSTFFQFYNPEFLKGFGVGVINGSLWTISVEIQFYLLTPLVHSLLRQKLFIIIFTLIILITLNGINTHLNTKDTLLQKIFDVSFFPWLYMFFLGAVASKFNKIFDIIRSIPIILASSIYVSIWLISVNFGLRWDNDINAVGYICLVILIIKFAISRPYLSDGILKRNDISYGVYIFHMPVVNFLVENERSGFNSWILALSATIVMALISWFVVERPLLRLKKRQLRSN